MIHTRNNGICISLEEDAILLSMMACIDFVNEKFYFNLFFLKVKLYSVTIVVGIGSC